MAAPTTYWIPNDRQKGYVTSTTQNANIDTQSNVDITTQDGTTILIVSPNIVVPIESTAWATTEV